MTALLLIAAAVVAEALVVAIAIRVFVHRPALRAHAAELHTAQRQAAELQTLLDRSKFDVEIAHAIEATTTESEIVDVVGRAVERVAEHMPAQLLLVGDDGGDVLRSATSTSTMSPAGGCPVATLAGCRAVQRGRTERFPTSDAIGACVHLRGRPDGTCSAVCVPVTVAGRSVGVLHVTSTVGEPAQPREVMRFEELATQAAQRISLLRAVSHATEQAATDPLTGAANRRALDSRVRRLVHDTTPFAIVIADLDHFKRVNDELGHDAGDRTLRTFADAMRRALRPEDLVVRFGGDEFVLVISQCNGDQAKTVLERVRREFARELQNGRLPDVTASFGVADSNTGSSLTSILTVADEALLDAKRAGRDRVQVAISLV